MQLVTEIKHWDWTTGQLTSVAYCTTHTRINVGKDVCHRCAVNVAFITVPLHPSTHPPTFHHSPISVTSSPRPALCQPVSPALPPATSQNCALCTATTRKFSEQLVTEGGGGEEIRGLWTGSVVRQRDRQQKKGETFFSLFGGIRGKKKTNKLQPARFSTVTTLFSAHLGDSFTTMSINSSLRPSNATM